MKCINDAGVCGQGGYCYNCPNKPTKDNVSTLKLLDGPKDKEEEEDSGKADHILEGAKGKYTSLMVIGWGGDEDDSELILSHTKDIGLVDCNWLLDVAKDTLLNLSYYDKIED